MHFVVLKSTYINCFEQDTVKPKLFRHQISFFFMFLLVGAGD